MCVCVCVCVCVSRPGGVPGDAGAAKLAGDLMLQGPLAEVHDVRCLINAHHPIGRASGQHQTHVLGSKLYVCHGCPTVHQRGSLNLRTQELVRYRKRNTRHLIEKKKKKNFSVSP